MDNQADKRIAVVVLGGFLGAGKSTILNRLLGEPEVDAARIAVIINEFGEASIDHLLVEAVVGDTTVLKNGCICCVIREDLSTALRELLDRCSQPDSVAIDRVIIETTGLADPGPIAKAIASDPLLARHLRFAGVVCAVDAVQCVEQLRDFALCRRQIACADAVVVTKVDVASAQQVLQACAAVQALNATAAVTCRDARRDPLRPIFDSLTCSALKSEASVLAVNQGWRVLARGDTGVTGLAGDIQSISVRLSAAVDWVAFSVWLSAFVHAYANSVLRIKGVLRLKAAPAPVLINVVRSFIHPPDRLDDTSELPEGSTLVFIVAGLKANRIEASLRHFVGE